MSEPSANPGNPHDEIDLRFIYAKLKAAVSGLWDAMVMTARIVRKRKIPILVFFFLGISAGVGFYYGTKPVYTSTMTLTSSTLSNDFCANIINNLQSSLNDNTPDLLASQLQVSVAVAKTITKIDFENFYEKREEDKDTVILGRPFKITLTVYDYTVFDTLQHALTKYLENNEYAQKRKKIATSNILLLKQKLESEIIQMDSLKNVIKSHLAPRGDIKGFVFGQPLDPINVYKEGIGMYQSLLNLNVNIAFIDNIQVIEGFYVRTKPSWPKLSYTLLLGAGIGFLLGLIVVFYLEAKR